jgi:hypothetical protein
MGTREPTPDRRDGGDHPEQEPPGQHPDSEHDPWVGPSLTIAEAARLSGVSVSTIRRYLAAERAHTIQTLESALRALQAQHAALAPNPDRAASFPAPPSGATYTAGPARQPGLLPMVPKRRPAKRQLSQEEKAAIIGRALSRQRPPKRR